MAHDLTDGLAELTAQRTSPLCSPSLATEVLTAAFDVGAAVPVTEMLPGGEACLPLWTELATEMTRRGWHAEVGWTDHDGQVVLLPPGKTAKDFDDCATESLTVEGYGDGAVRIVIGHASPDADLEFACSVDCAIGVLGLDLEPSDG